MKICKTKKNVDKEINNLCDRHLRLNSKTEVFLPYKKNTTGTPMFKICTSYLFQKDSEETEHFIFLQENL